MAKITLELPDELLQQLTAVGDRLPELLALSLRQPAIPANFYRYILDFISQNPTPEQIAAFKPTDEMQERLQLLLARSKTGNLTSIEQAELDEYEHIEHLIILLKTNNLQALLNAS
ncbi:hypothetical protein [Leptolyngbya sp. NIES-2104]|uniref:hypothetical protein n=1 Tax=Leptolyngbya sp. NIES-2104 TaxID=1552121 RepID=UPI0006EC6527|nr:hypothetical protein [Leptolyngbya sp. NIES-2104]GAP95326.1 hypothetical protein NIES2104_18470 [Leptolyngbya sp. NIES-2104]